MLSFLSRTIRARVRFAFFVFGVITVMALLYSAMRFAVIDKSYSDVITANSAKLSAAVSTLTAAKADPATISALSQVATDLKDSSGKVSKSVNGSIIYLLVMTVLCSLIGFVKATSLAMDFEIPVRQLTEYLRGLADGKLTRMESTNRLDEVGELTRVIALATDKTVDFTGELGAVCDEYISKGNASATLRADAYKNDMGALAKKFNAAYGKIAGDLAFVTDSVAKLSDGRFDFKASAEQSDAVKQPVEKLKNELSALVSDIAAIDDALTNGKFATRVDLTRYSAGFAVHAAKFNHFFDELMTNFSESLGFLDGVSKGNLSARITREFKGDYNGLKSCANGLADTIGSYIKEISFILSEMSNSNFDLEVKNAYVGDFAPIKTALNAIIEMLNGTLDDINASALTVADGASFMSDSSQTLANGASEQATYVSELLNTLETISAQTRSNSETVNSANVKVVASKENAALSSQEMSNMLTAMDEINAASSNISKIIKVIQDISFQTNLLALNAAVEAARAGAAGKGFAVVAEEVRMLADRSKQAADETTKLIQGSMSKVDDGIKIATKTSHTLGQMVSVIDEISVIMVGVTESSSKQDEAIKQMTTGVMRISDLARANTSTSEQQASSAEELHSQSELFKNMVSKFRLRKAGGVRSGSMSSAGGSAVAGRSLSAYSASGGSRKPTYDSSGTRNYSSENKAPAAVIYSYSDESTVGKPTVGSPSEVKPVAVKPVAVKPIGVKPVTAKPSVTMTSKAAPSVKPTGITSATPSAVKSVSAVSAAKPSSAKPATANATTNKPDFVRPAVTKPSAYDSSSPTPVHLKASVKAKIPSGAADYNKSDFGKY